MREKELYRRFCEEEEELPIYSQAYWLDAVCTASGWDVILIEEDGAIIASMPYQLQRRFGCFEVINMPKLTQTMGPYIKYPQQQRYEKRLAYEKKIMRALIGKLPHFDKFAQAFHRSVTNWLPFYWSGFKQTVKYTYVILKERSLDEIFASFAPANRSQIRKAQKNITIVESSDLEKLYQYGRMTFERRHSPACYCFEDIQRIDKALRPRHQCKILFAVDAEGHTHSAIYLVWDKKSLYSIISGFDAKFHRSGAHNLLVWHAIQFAHGLGVDFDFEGSMIYGVERFIRGFGARQNPYFVIYRTDSGVLQLRDFCYDVLKG